MHFPVYCTPYSFKVEPQVKAGYFQVDEQEVYDRTRSQLEKGKLSAETDIVEMFESNTNTDCTHWVNVLLIANKMI